MIFGFRYSISLWLGCVGTIDDPIGLPYNGIDTIIAQEVMNADHT
jgi:hypothetical protein